MSDRTRLALRGGVLALILAMILPMAALANPTDQPRQDEAIHVVQRGETLASIAARYRTTISQLIRLNGLRNPNIIFVGQRLRVPALIRPAAAPAAAPPPSSVPAAAPSVAPAASDAANIVHVVQRGEYLASIANRYGVSVQALLRANRLSNPNLLRVGQRLIIPRGANAVAAAPAAAPAETTTAVVNAPTSGRWIDVNVTTQTLSAYEGDKLVFTTKVSTGRARTPTVLGRFRIRTKLRAQAMSGPGYYLPNVPYVMYFHRGYAIHGTYWHNNFGHPMSHGCVNMRTTEAKWLYEWAPVGTLVVTHR